MSINGHEINCSIRSGGWRDQRDGVPLTDLQNSEQRELEAGEFEGEELGGDARAEERASLPCRRQAVRVVGVEVRQKIHLIAFRPPVHIYHSSLHSSISVQKSEFSFKLIFHDERERERGFKEIAEDGVVV